VIQDKNSVRENIFLKDVSGIRTPEKKIILKYFFQNKFFYF